MPIYNLVDYSKNYSKTTGLLWNHYRNEQNNGTGGADNNIRFSIKYSKSFDYKVNITGRLERSNTEKVAEIDVHWNI